MTLISISCREAADSCVLLGQAPHTALPASPEPILLLQVKAQTTRFVSQMPRDPMGESYGGALELWPWTSALASMS